VDPGVHVAEAIADGFEPAVTAWLAEARRGRTIDLALVPIEVAPPPRPQPTVEPLPRLESLQPLEPELTAVPPRVGPASDPEPKRGISGWAWVSAGIGVAALVTGGVFGVLAVNDRGEMDQLEADARAMPGVPFRDRIEEVADRGERNRSVAIAGLSAGAVAAAAGIVLFLLDGAP
jgi:hypothetical protein